jgi:hypothetical protein
MARRDSCDRIVIPDGGHHAQVRLWRRHAGNAPGNLRARSTPAYGALRWVLASAGRVRSLIAPKKPEAQASPCAHRHAEHSATSASSDACEADAEGRSRGPYRPWAELLKRSFSQPSTDPCAGGWRVRCALWRAGYAAHLASRVSLLDHACRLSSVFHPHRTARAAPRPRSRTAA